MTYETWQNKSTYQTELKTVVKRIRRIKEKLGHINFERNTHLHKSYARSGIYAELNQKDEYTYYSELALTSTSLEEFRKKVFEDCTKSGHRLHNMDNEWISCFDCDAGYYYNRCGGDSLFLFYQFEKEKQEREKKLMQEIDHYSMILEMIKSVKE